MYGVTFNNMNKPLKKILKVWFSLYVATPSPLHKLEKARCKGLVKTYSEGGGMGRSIWKCGG